MLLIFIYCKWTIYDKYNIENNIHFYRITSALIPLITHPEVEYFDYRKMFKKDFQYIGKLINESNMRVDTHPDEFNVINSVNLAVVESAKNALNIHVDWFEEMNYDKGKMVMHVGGATGGKEAGIERFINNFSTYPERIKNKVILENDDKTYTASETLKICKTLNKALYFAKEINDKFNTIIIDKIREDKIDIEAARTLTLSFNLVTYLSNISNDSK